MMYTPRAYHPYDLMRCFKRWEREALGGRTGSEVLSEDWCEEDDERVGDVRRAGK